MTTNTKSNEYQWLYTKFDEFLGQKGLKQTKQRYTVIHSFLSHEGHMSAEELHEMIKSDGHNIGLATVYRTLNLLKEAGFVEQKQFAEDKSVFELLKPGEHHDHLVCVECKEVLEFENEAIEHLQIEVAKSFGYTLLSHNLDLYGICSKCQPHQAN